MSGSRHQKHLAQAAGLAASGRRVLLLARVDGPLDGEALSQNLRPAAFILLTERLRSDTAEAIAFLTAQGVALKVISRDSPHTVSAVPARVRLPSAGDPVDARDLPGDIGLLGAAGGAFGLWPGDSAAEAGDGDGAAGAARPARDHPAHCSAGAAALRACGSSRVGGTASRRSAARARASSSGAMGREPVSTSQSWPGAAPAFSRRLQACAGSIMPRFGKT
jgi:hypothetical protein